MDKNSDRFFDWSGKDLFKSRLIEAMNGESSRAFAARCGLSDTVIRNYLNSKTYPSIDRLAMIANAVGKPIEWFLIENKNNQFEEKNYHIDESELENKLHAIFELMSMDEKMRAVEIFKNNGLKGLMPTVLDPNEVSNREILQQRDTHTNPTSASSVSTHDQKAG